MKFSTDKFARFRKKDVIWRLHLSLACCQTLVTSVLCRSHQSQTEGETPIVHLTTQIAIGRSERAGTCCVTYGSSATVRRSSDDDD